MATTVTALSSTFTTLINSLMEIERQPLTRLTAKRDSLTTQRAVYNDLKTRLDGLQSAVRALSSTNPFYALKAGRTVNVSGASVAGATVMSATASISAQPGSYTLSNVTLAREQRAASDQQTYIDQALGHSGDFYLGGAASRAISGETLPTSSAVTGFGVSTQIAPGQNELGQGNRVVETRYDPDASTWQFRLVDGDGQETSIQRAGSSEFTDGWQPIPTVAGVYDTGRGLTISFGDNPGNNPSDYQPGVRGDAVHPPAQVTYAAQGALISVSVGDTLNDIASKINKASYAAGNGVSATIVDRRLVLSAESTGIHHAILASEVVDPAHPENPGVLQDLGILAGSDFAHQLQAASDAQFILNGILVQRSQNSNLTDVVSGVSLNLAADAEGKSATLTINSDNTPQTNAVKDFVEKFNTLTTYLADKQAVTKNADSTYTRGSLAGESTFTGLRMDLLGLVGHDAITASNQKNLRELGLTLNGNLKLELSDATKLEKALASNTTGVQSLLDTVMASADTMLGRFTGSNSYLDYALRSNDAQSKDLGDQITSMNGRLAKRQEALTNQYGELQAQLYMLQYTQQQMNTIYSTVSSLA
ncbi:MAG: flagellar filament capping protein FliD [Anaerolineaceae bacterium]|nr:flagellar filament capping protein FliD [Anaerolineaceae bacterium]